MILFEFITEPITRQIIDKHTSKNIDYSVGATASFTGTVRADVIDNKNVVAIEFTTDEEISKQITVEILEIAHKAYSTTHVFVLHSLGEIKTGQACFYVEVCSGHRREAFKALNWIVDSFKAKTPVFGKEILEDGTYVWKTNKI